MGNPWGVTGENATPARLGRANRFNEDIRLGRARKALEFPTRERESQKPPCPMMKRIEGPRIAVIANPTNGESQHGSVLQTVRTNARPHRTGFRRRELAFTILQ